MRPILSIPDDSPDAIPAFAIAAPAAILAAMPPLEIKPTHKDDCLRQSVLQKAFSGNRFVQSPRGQPANKSGSTDRKKGTKYV